MEASNPYTFNASSDGNVEVLQNGTRISTGTADAASKYGYVAPAAPAPAPTPAAKAAMTTESTHKTAADSLSGSTLGDGSNPFVSSSDSIQNHESTVANSVNDLNSNNQALTDAHNQYLAQNKQEADALEIRRQNELAVINSEFDAEKTKTQTAQDRETGAMNVSLQRSGGYLGAGASQTGALISLNQTHATEMAQLEAKRQSAIQQANSAIDDKQFTLAEAKAKEAKDLEQTINDRKDKYFSQQLEVQNSARQQDQFLKQTADDSLKKLATMTPDDIKSIPPSTLANLDKTFGIPGFSQHYLQVNQQVNQIKNQKDAIDYQNNMLDLLQKIPQGQTVTFPDPTNPYGPGTTYTGMGKVGDISTFNETDAGGNVTIIAYNKATNTVTKTPVGAVGKPDSALLNDNLKTTRLNYMQEYMGDPKNKIMVSSDPANPDAPRYMTANDYISMYQKYTKQYPGKGSEFTDQFPVAQTVLPSQVKATESKFIGVTDKSQTRPATEVGK